jgi:hypothetical protein
LTDPKKSLSKNATGLLRQMVAKSPLDKTSISITPSRRSCDHELTRVRISWDIVLANANKVTAKAGLGICSDLAIILNTACGGGCSLSFGWLEPVECGWIEPCDKERTESKEEKGDEELPV